MICAIILNVTVRSKKPSLLDNFKLKVDRLKAKCNFFKGTQTAWNKFLKSALNIGSAYSGMAVSARTKNPQNVKATSDNIKNKPGGKISSLTDMHGNGLRIKVL